MNSFRTPRGRERDASTRVRTRLAWCGLPSHQAERALWSAHGVGVKSGDHGNPLSKPKRPQGREAPWGRFFFAVQLYLEKLHSARPHELVQRPHSARPSPAPRTARRASRRQRVLSRTPQVRARRPVLRLSLGRRESGALVPGTRTGGRLGLSWQCQIIRGLERGRPA